MEKPADMSEEAQDALEWGDEQEIDDDLSDDEGISMPTLLDADAEDDDAGSNAASDAESDDNTGEEVTLGPAGETATASSAQDDAKILCETLRILIQHHASVPNELTFLREALQRVQGAVSPSKFESKSPLDSTEMVWIYQVVQRILLGGDQLTRLRAACAMQTNAWQEDEKKALVGTQPVLEDFHMVRFCVSNDSAALC